MIPVNHGSSIACFCVFITEKAKLQSLYLKQSLEDIVFFGLYTIIICYAFYFTDGKK